MFLEPFQLFFLVDIHCFLAPQPRWDVLFTTFNTVPFLEDRNEIAKKNLQSTNLVFFLFTQIPPGLLKIWSSYYRTRLLNREALLRECLEWPGLALPLAGVAVIVSPAPSAHLE